MFSLQILGDSMNVRNTFWPNLAMKTWFFTHVLHRSPRNSYILCEFRLVFKKQIVEYCVDFSMIFFLKIFRCHLMCEFSHLMKCVTLKFWKKLISGDFPRRRIFSYINNFEKQNIWVWFTQNALLCGYFFVNFFRAIQLFIIFRKWSHPISASF